MKITSVKLFQSVRIGNDELTFIPENKYEMWFDGFLLHVEFNGQVIVIPATNIPWMKVDSNEHTKNEQIASTTNIRRTLKKKE
jgi:hypothetical protein